ncbi:MAG TPA: hypothetical protein VMW04_03345 [Patescibacteria group bacterium]|nr:hypothetical protein [Patescibacteria group bacterium]
MLISKLIIATFGLELQGKFGSWYYYFMELWQKIVLLVYALINLVVFARGFYECKVKKNAYGLTRPLFFLGVFAWGDAVVFCLFWLFSSIVVLLLNDWYLFLLIVSVFWVVRSLGETIYWFNQQFSKSLPWNKPEKLPFYSIFHNDSVWFIHQIIWQCTTVVSTILSLYFGRLWLLN